MLTIILSIIIILSYVDYVNQLYAIDLHHLRREVGKTHMSPSWFRALVLDQNFQRKQAEKTGDVSETRDVPNFHWKSSEERPQKDNHTTWWNSFQIEKYEHLMNIFQNSKNLHDFKGCSSHSFSTAHSYSELTSHSEGHTGHTVPCYDPRSDIKELDPQKPTVQFTTEGSEPRNP